MKYKFIKKEKIKAGFETRKLRVLHLGNCSTFTFS